MTGTHGAEGSGEPVADPRDYVQDGLVLIGVSKSGRDLDARVHRAALANRHGLITGATGTGKTVTLQVLAEGFSAAGVPVFAADIKGDLSGIAATGEPSPKLVERAEEIGLTRYGNAAFPTVVLGHLRRRRPSRARDRAGDGTAASVAPDGADGAAGGRAQHRFPLGGGRAQGRRRQDGRSSISRICASVIDEMGKKAATLRSKYGNIAPATVGVIQRRLLVLEEQGADKFFGEPALDIMDFLRGRRRTAAASSTFSPPRS